MAKRFIDYAFKSKVLNEHEDLLIWQKRASLFEYSKKKLEEEGVVLYALKTNKKGYTDYIDIETYCKDNGLTDVLKECFRINHAEYERTRRLKERVAKMLLSGSCIFLTLTFTDDTLNNTTLKQRRVAVTRFLKQYGCMYVANIDYGAKNKREHYHALINCDNVDFASWRKYGNINAERVRIKDINKDMTKLSKYICKLSNHAIKETTQRSSLLYSR